MYNIQHKPPNWKCHLSRSSNDADGPAEPPQHFVLFSNEIGCLKTAPAEGWEICELGLKDDIDLMAGTAKEIRGITKAAARHGMVVSVAKGQAVITSASSNHALIKSGIVKLEEVALSKYPTVMVTEADELNRAGFS